MAVASIERTSSPKSSVLKEEYDSRHHEKDLPIPNIASGDESGFWKTFAAAPDNETQRGMHSWHLMMIGGSDLGNKHSSRPSFFLSSYWSDNWDWNLLERWIGWSLAWHNLGFFFI